MPFSFILAKRNYIRHIKNKQLKRGKRRNLQFHGAIWTSAGSHFTLQCFTSPSPLNNSHCLPNQLLGKKKKTVRSSRVSGRRRWSVREAGRNRDSLQMPVTSNRAFKESSQCWFLSGIWVGSQSKSFHLARMCFCCADISQVSKTVPGFCGPVWIWQRGKGIHRSTGLNLPLPWQDRLTMLFTELTCLYLHISVISRNPIFFFKEENMTLDWAST